METLPYKYYLIMDKHYFSPKMCHKKFENRFTNKNLTSKNVFEKRFLHAEIVSRVQVTIFWKIMKVFIFY